MDVRLLFPNEYIAAADLIDAQKKTGEDGVVLTISRVSIDSLKTNRGSEKKPVVWFVEMERRHEKGKGENKRLVLNKTNAKTIAKLYGYETNEWKGKRIILYPTQCEAFGETVDCVRIKDQAPPAKSNGKRPQEREPGEDQFDAPPPGGYVEAP